MGIPVQQFPLLSFEQANPIYTSMNAGAELAHKLMMNQQQRISNQQQVVANKYFEPTLQEQLKQLQLNTQILTPQAENAPQMADAALREAIANTLYKQAVTKDLESMLPSKLKAAELKGKYPLMGEPGMAGQLGGLQYATENIPGFNNQFTVTPDQYGQLAQGVQGAGGNVQLNQQPAISDTGTTPQVQDQMGTGVVDPRKIALALAALKQSSAQQQSGMPFKQALSPIPQGLQQGQQPQAAGQQPQLSGQQPQSMADIFKKSIFNELANKNAQTGWYQARTAGIGWNSMPADQKDALLAQASGAGIDASEAVKMFQNGMTLPDIMATKGYKDPAHYPPQNYPATTGTRTSMQTRTIAGKEAAPLFDFAINAIAPYSKTIFGYSPKLFEDSMNSSDSYQQMDSILHMDKSDLVKSVENSGIKNDNYNKQVDFLASMMIMPDLMGIRFRQLNGQRIGVEVLNELTNASAMNVKYLRPQFSEKVWKDAAIKAQDLVNQATDIGSTATYYGGFGNASSTKGSGNEDPLGIR